MNKDEALRCLDLSRDALAQGNHERAIKFAEKSLRLCETEEVCFGGCCAFACALENPMHMLASTHPLFVPSQRQGKLWVLQLKRLQPAESNGGATSSSFSQPAANGNHSTASSTGLHKRKAPAAGDTGRGVEVCKGWFGWVGGDGGGDIMSTSTQRAFHHAATPSCTTKRSSPASITANLHHTADTRAARVGQAHTIHQVLL